MAIDRSALQARLRGLFLDELDEHVQTLDEGLVALEQHATSSGEDPLVHELFRAAHSLKGAAQAAGVEPLVALCFQLEEGLSALRDGSSNPTPAVVGPLLAGVDALSAAGRRLRGGGEAAGPDVALAFEQLVALRLTAGGATRDVADGSPRLVEEPGVDTDTDIRVEPEPEPEPESGGEVAAATWADGPLAPRAAVNVRISAARLSDLLNDASEVVLAGRRVHALADELAETAQALRTSGVAGGDITTRLDHLERLARSTAQATRALTSGGTELADSLRRARMTPLADATGTLERVVRDAAVAGQKDVRLHIQVGDVEVDRALLDVISGTLLHLVKNAVDHGIELPAVRAAAGKPAAGNVTVTAELGGEGVSISVADDGRGLDREALRAAARRRNIALPDDDEDDRGEIAFLPGVTTSPIITDTSGRGVGLDAVRARVEGVGGTATLQSESGTGTIVTFTVPLGLFAMRALFVAVAGEVLALPSSSVTQLLRVTTSDLRSLGDRHVVHLDGRAIPVMWLDDVLDLPATGQQRVAPYRAVVVGAAPHHVVLLVDDLLTEEEIVLKPLGHDATARGGVLGATILPSGRVALVLNPSTCVRAGLARRSAPVSPAGTPVRARTQRVLLAEDSLTTRALERSILESAGYEVIVAVDGMEAWDLLNEHGADIVVSDVNMPRLEGVELCEALRSSPRFNETPFILVTSLATEADRRRGIEAGANAYIVKAEFDQGLLLDTIARLL